MKGKEIIDEIDNTVSNLEHKDITEEKKVIKVGPGQFDYIGIHRIMANHHNDDKSKHVVVMIPGSNSDFNTSFNARFSGSYAKMGRFLARQGIDVWGIDFRYSFVPDNFGSSPYCTVQDCSFFKDQNIALHLSDLDIVVKIAQFSSKDGRVFLLGHSQGAYFAYKYTADLTDQPGNIKGIIPIDIVYNLDQQFTDVVMAAKADVIDRNSKIARGIWYEDITISKQIAELALTDPNGTSPIIPGFTNLQAALFAITATYQLPGFSTPGFRQAQGTLAGLTHTDFDFIANQALHLNSFQSILPITEIQTNRIQPVQVIPHIIVPIHYVGAMFGFGNFGLYTPDQIKAFNSNVTEVMIPDYGHADVIDSITAKDDVWEEILHWIRDH